jgi:hypothetical protein
MGLRNRQKVFGQDCSSPENIVMLPKKATNFSLEEDKTELLPLLVTVSPAKKRLMTGSRLAMACRGRQVMHAISRGKSSSRMTYGPVAWSLPR